MAFEFGTHTEFDDEVSFGDPVVAVAARAIDLPKNKGAFFQAMGAPTLGIDTKSFEVFSRSKTAREGTVGGAGWDIDDVVGLDVDSTSVKGLTIGHVVKVENEVVIIKAVNRAGNTVDIYARGAGGTTAATHASGVSFKVVGFAGKDSTLKDVESVFESTGKYTNHIQTVFETLDYEYMGEILRTKGLEGGRILSILTKEAAFRVAEMLAPMSVLGEKQLGVKGGTPYMSAGLLSQLGDSAGGSRPILSYDADSGPITEPKLRAALAEVVKTGSPNILWCSAKNKEVINSFNGSLTTQIQRTEHVAGQYINQYDYEGLVLNIRVDSDLTDANIPIVNQRKCYKSWLKDDNLRTEQEPKLSSRESRESIQGSLGFLIEDVGYEHINIGNISNS